MQNKTMFSLSLFLVLLSLPLSQSSYAAQDCASVFGTTLPKEGDWRKNNTHPAKGGGFVATSAQRETEMADRTKLMGDEVLGIGMHGDTPPIEFFVADGVTYQYVKHSQGTGGIVTRIAVSGLGASGVVKGTLLVPVSGHTGAVDAKNWSKTDTYTIRTDVSTDANGSSWTGSHYGDSATVLVQDAKSLDLITAQELEVSLVKGRIVRLIYFRSGSGGPAGYYEGRVLELVWDGT
jgi:hypothetical protein